ncbi:hypothetical protein PROFUN_11494 [Planoprotostelium fungivorum]|uniref:Uncharacterized protein n=1 Tax=Planoprotostelium fungivorum TaxID=1890364 RepID=A0A2P6N9X2_9EUKA|nr:hypothetical protein PROFUN_11494 [Planoprotostelium fungivorum]
MDQIFVPEQQNTQTQHRLLLLGERQGKKSPEGVEKSLGLNDSGSTWSNFWRGFGWNIADKNKPSHNITHNGPSKRVARNIFSVLPGDTQWISCILVSRWDNISGPRVEHVWSGTETLGEDNLMSVSRQTLCGELAREDTDENASVESKFHLLPEIGYCFTSFVFTAPYGQNAASSRFSLSIVVRMKLYQKYLMLHNIVEDRMLQLVSQLQTLLVKDWSTAINVFSVQLQPFVTKMEDVFHSSLPPPLLSRTFVHHPSQYTPEFISRVVTSHLQTHGSTIIIGSDPERINTFIDSLCMFNISWNERHRSSHCRSPSTFIPDLAIQGVVTTTISEEEVIQSMLPSTVVDLNTFIVKQTPPFHEYNILRKNYLRSQLDSRDKSLQENPWKAQELFRVVKTGAPLVDKLLGELYGCPTYLRTPFLVQSVKLLVRKAIQLIRYVQAEIERSHVRQLEANTVKKIRVHMDLGQESDFYLLLGIAEKLFPGIYVMLAGDPAFFIELQFIELFESF